MFRLPNFVIGAGVGAVLGAILGAVGASFTDLIGTMQGIIGGGAIFGFLGLIVVAKYGQGN